MDLQHRLDTRDARQPCLPPQLPSVGLWARGLRCWLAVSELCQDYRKREITPPIPMPPLTCPLSHAVSLIPKNTPQSPPHRRAGATGKGGGEPIDSLCPRLPPSERRQCACSSFAPSLIEGRGGVDQVKAPSKESQGHKPSRPLSGRRRSSSRSSSGW